MKKFTQFFFPAARLPVAVLALLVLAQPLQAGALLTLKGETDATRNAADGEVRLSVLGWSGQDERQAIVEQWRKLQDGGDTAAFSGFLKGQQTHGYLFTREATGYSIKYAWQDPDAGRDRMLFVVTPALRSLNPYLWKDQTRDDRGFSVLELRYPQGQEAAAELRVLPGAQVQVARDDLLEVRDADAAGIFARLRDNTPYYLKDNS